MSQLQDVTLTTTKKPQAHIHLFSNDHRDITALELASVWIGSLLFLFFILLLSKNIYRSVKTPSILKNLKTYSEGPFHSTERSADGTIVPALNYFENEKAKDILRSRRPRNKKEHKKQRRKRERIAKNAVRPDDDYVDSMMFLEMQMFQMDEDDSKIIHYFEDKSQEEIIIDEILSMPMDNLRVPDRFLSPIVERPSSSRTMSTVSSSRRMSGIPSSPDENSITFIPLPSPLCPSYLPSKPVTGIWSKTHSTDHLYRYTHIERIVYPPERVIFPPGFAS